MSKLVHDIVSSNSEMKFIGRGIRRSMFDMHLLKQVEGHIEEVHQYDPLKIPPNWEIAKEHQKAIRIAKEKPRQNGVPVQIDGMSGFQIDNELLPLGCDIEELSFLSPAYPMYFHFFKFTFIVLFILLGVSGIHAIVVNYNGDYCRNTGVEFSNVTRKGLKAVFTDCSYSFATATSLANRHGDDATEYVQQQLNLAAFIAIVIALQFFRRSQRKMGVEIDERSLTPADFTFEVHGIPTIQDQDVDEELKAFFTENGLEGDEKLNIKKIVLSYDVTDKMRCLQKIEVLSEKRARGIMIVAKTNDEARKEKLKKISEEIETLKVEVNKLNKEFKEGVSQRFTGSAFISVATQQELQKVLKRWTNPVFTKILPFHDRVLLVKTGSEPSDIFWENLNFSPASRSRRSFGVRLIIVIVLAVCFIAILIIGVWKKGIIDNTKASKRTHEKFVVSLITIASSLLTVIVNYLLKTIIYKLALYEKHRSWTEYDISISRKLSIAQFFNTAIITFAASYIFKNYWGEGGLIAGMFSIFRTNCILPPIISLINGGYIYRVLRREKIKKEGDETTYNQRQINEISEYFAFSFPFRYAELLKNMFTAAFYAPVLPFGIIWTLIGNILVYWTHKYILLRSSKRDRALSDALPIEMTELLEFVIIIFGVSNLIFDYIFSGNISNLSIGMLVLAIINALLPMQEINDAVFGKVEEKLTDDTYDQLRLEFDEDYDRCNPALNEEALKNYEKELKLKKTK